EFFISKSEYAKWIKKFQKTKTSLVKYDCKRHKLFICRFCFGEWFYKSDSCQKQLNQSEKQKIREIQSGQWRDKGKKIYRPVADIVYWPKNRHWESIKDIPDSTALSIHDSITRYRNSYLNRGGGSGKTTQAIKIFKDINIVVFTHTNALAKDFQNNQWTPERMGEKKFLRVVIWDEVCTVPKHILEKFIDYLLEQKYQEVLTDYRAKCSKLYELKKGMRHKNNRVQSELFRRAIPVIEKWKYLEKKWSPSD
ncbi:8441_t:CDS:2, partial [Racocetra persica]